MTPDDHRHGTPAGYQAGCRDTCCRVPHDRARVRRQLRLLAGQVNRYTVADVDALLAPWEALGVSRTAICDAAGVTHRGVRPMNASTYARVAAITEHDLPDRTMVYADLTRRRVFSLLAAGHTYADMGMLATGRWRYQERVRVGTARAARAAMRRLEMTPGRHTQTAARARNAGHRPPLAWDDPDTLAWPQGWTQETHVEPGADQVLIDRVVAGEHHLVRAATRAEREAIVARFRAAGMPLRALEVAGIQPGRYMKEGAA